MPPASRPAPALRLVRFLVCGAVAFLTPPVLGAQATVRTELSASSAMVWRGVTTTNRPVLNPTLELTLPTRWAELVAGAWSNAEPVHYRPATMLDSYGGAPGPLFSMHELWAEASRPVLGATASLGASAYLYPRVDGLAAQYNTLELHGSIELPGAIAPTVSAHIDVGRVRGSYFEVSGDRDLPGPRGRALSLAASAGWSVGQGAGSHPEAIAYFQRDGFTHSEASIGTELQLGTLFLTPSVHLAYAVDPWAREVAPDRERRIKVWVGTALSWSRVLGAEPAAADALGNADRRQSAELPKGEKSGKVDRAAGKGQR